MTEPAYDADLSNAEPRGGHIKGRPISWTVVVLVSGGFLVAGIGLTTATPWLFIVGLAVVVLGGILGWATHAMADSAARVERKAARAAERRRLAGANETAEAGEQAATVNTPPSARLATDDADRDSSQASVRG
jgi:hypothetical protein